MKVDWIKSETEFARVKINWIEMKSLQKWKLIELNRKKKKNSKKNES